MLYRSRQHPQPGRVAFVGLIRRYKAVDVLIRAFGETGGSSVLTELVVAGNPTSADLAAEITTLASDDPRVTLRLDFLSEAEWARTVRESSLVVLPAPEMHNSGTVLAVLSLGRRVLVPSNVVNRQLALEVGESWLPMFDPPLSGADVERAVRATTRMGDLPAPDLSRRGWSGVALAHVQAYRRAQAAVAGRGSGARGSARQVCDK